MQHRHSLYNPETSQLVSLTHGLSTYAEGTPCNHWTGGKVRLHSPRVLENKNISYLSGHETKLVIWDRKMILTGNLTESARHGLSEPCHSWHLSCWHTSSTATYSYTVTVRNISSKQPQYVQGFTMCSAMHHLVMSEQTSTPLICVNGIVRHSITVTFTWPNTVWLKSDKSVYAQY